MKISHRRTCLLTRVTPIHNILHDKVTTAAVRDLNVIHVTYKRMHIGSTGSRLSDLNVEYSQAI